MFRLFESKRTDSFEQFLEASPGFTNPNIEECLYKELGLDFDHHYTNMSSLRGRFPQQEYSNELRQVQATKWAFRYVNCVNVFILSLCIISNINFVDQ